jgi:hypothetical protein
MKGTSDNVFLGMEMGVFISGVGYLGVKGFLPENA